MSNHNITTTTDKLEIAAQFLFSKWENGQCIYFDNATREKFICKSEDEMIELYFMISGDAESRETAYTLWCSQTSHQMVV